MKNIKKYKGYNLYFFKYLKMKSLTITFLVNSFLSSGKKKFLSTLNLINLGYHLGLLNVIRKRDSQYVT